MSFINKYILRVSLFFLSMAMASGAFCLDPNASLDWMDSEKIGVSFSELFADPKSYDGKEISLVGYLEIDRAIRLFESIDSINSRNDGLGGVFINGNRSELMPYDGCYIALNGIFKKVYKDRDFFHLTDISYVNRTGMFYLFAQDLMKKNGIEGEPKCLGKALVELMATPKAPQ